MPVLTFRAFPAAGVVALFDEAPGGGDPKDIGSLRNRPAADPANWLPNIYFHSSLDNMEVHSDTTVTINHGSVAALTPPGLEFVPSRYFAYGSTATTWPLLTHDLGYPPHVAVVVDDNVVKPGYPVQVVSGTKRMRSISVYVTTTQVLLREWSIATSDGSIPAISKTYRILVFRDPPAPEGNKLLEIDATAGTVKMARGRFDLSRNYLQVVPGGSPFGLSSGRSIDLKRGAVRFADPDGSNYDMVPTDFQIRFNPPGNGGGILYYDGSFTGSGILVQAP